MISSTTTGSPFFTAAPGAATTSTTLPAAPAVMEMLPAAPAAAGFAAGAGAGAAALGAGAAAGAPFVFSSTGYIIYVSVYGNCIIFHFSILLKQNGVISVS